MVSIENGGIHEVHVLIVSRGGATVLMKMTGADMQVTLETEHLDPHNRPWITNQRLTVDNVDFTQQAHMPAPVALPLPPISLLDTTSNPVVD